MLKLISLILAFMALPFFASAQGIIGGNTNLLEERKQILENLSHSNFRYSLSQQLKLSLAQTFDFPMILPLENGKVAEFQYIDESGLPVYYTTLNVNAAITTGASALQTNGNLNQNLSGKDMVVGVYDQTRPKFDHREFSGRLIQKDGSSEEFSVHATHVAGTILASGININAKGMANEAIGWTFNWESDISKMSANGYDPDLNPEGTIISNHSYGIVLGWYRNSSGNWAWAGNANINPNEDYRFGFYSSKSQALDQLAFAKPYYSIVWAAGNDRSDVGDGTRHPDGPEDTIGPEGVAKNNFTIGAVSSVLNYQGPTSISMSSFSSWGPTDDGRIKPDLVAMGVNVFSTSLSGDSDQYANLSGTSMAAPNATGSLFLLQELFYKRNSNRYMKSATLKALSIHTAREAGAAPGPDYIYGWGLLNVEAAANLVINEDGSSNVIRELVLNNNGVYEYELLSDGIQPIRATIAWTDPAGTPVAPSLNPTNRMLVNDLDLRIFDEDGVEHFPWSLDPSRGSSATAINSQDNIRDNVEQVIINNPSPKKYYIRVRHKGSLINGLQHFSLILTAGVTAGSDKTLYWIGADSNWSNPNNWSLVPNGASANLIPDSKTRVVFDQIPNVTSQQINLSEASTAFSINFFGSSSINFNLDNQTLTLNGIRVSNQNTTFRSGTLVFNNELENDGIIDMGSSTLDQTAVNVQGGNWNFISGNNLPSLIVGAARLNVNLERVSLGSMTFGEGSQITGELREVTFSGTLSIDPTAAVLFPLNLIFAGNNGSITDASNKAFDDLIINSGRLSLDQIGPLGDLILAGGEVQIAQNLLIVDNLTINSGTVLNLLNNNRLEVKEGMSNPGEGENAIIQSDNRGKLIFNRYIKYCFENLNVRRVDFEGDAIITLGVNAHIENSNNWLNQRCEDVLFADFTSNFLCVGGITQFTNQSEGNVTEYLWTFGSLGTSTLPNPNFVFPQEGSYVVMLEVSNDAGGTKIEKTVEVSGNTLNPVEIVVNNNTLTSLRIGMSYQWYLNEQPIEGATNRSYVAENDGAYQVAIFDENCNRISDPVVISALTIDKHDDIQYGIIIGANPTQGEINIEISNEYKGAVEFSVVSMSGQLLLNNIVYKDNFVFNGTINLNSLPGVYVLKIKFGDLIINRRIIKI